MKKKLLFVSMVYAVTLFGEASEKDIFDENSLEEVENKVSKLSLGALVYEEICPPITHNIKVEYNNRHRLKRQQNFLFHTHAGDPIISVEILLENQRKNKENQKSSPTPPISPEKVQTKKRKKKEIHDITNALEDMNLKPEIKKIYKFEQEKENIKPDPFLSHTFQLLFHPGKIVKKKSRRIPPEI